MRSLQEFYHIIKSMVLSSLIFSAQNDQIYGVCGPSDFILRLMLILCPKIGTKRNETKQMSPIPITIPSYSS